MKRFIMWFAPHIQQRAIYYVLVSYGIFVIANLAYLGIDNPYGLAMACIGFFWLGVIYLFKLLKNRMG